MEKLRLRDVSNLPKITGSIELTSESKDLNIFLEETQGLAKYSG